MPDWLNASFSGGAATAPGLLAWRIGVALLLGVYVSGLYRWARRGESITPTFVTTLILLSTLIAMATQVIGDNVARAFSLVGALSVVRFRTVVKDTQDTAFVIVAVVVGMAAGSNHLAVALVGLAILTAAALFLWPPGRNPEGWQGADCKLSMRVSMARGVQATAESLLATAADRVALASAATARQGTALDLVYRLRLRGGTMPTSLVSELNMIEGVEGIELRRED